MPVGTRSTFGTHDHAQHSGMAADYGARSIGMAHIPALDQNSAPNEQHKEEEQQGARPPSTPAAASIKGMIKAIDGEIARERTTLDELRSGGLRPRLSQLAREIARASAKRAERPSPPPRPRIEDEPTRDMEELGASIGASVKSVLNSLVKEKTGSYIPPETAKHLLTGLEVEERATFRATIKTKCTLADPRVRELMAIKYENVEDYVEQVRELGLRSVDARLASTVYACLKEKEEAPYVGLLMGATEEDEVLAASGRLMLDWVDEETEEGVRDDPVSLKNAFDATPFFVSGAPVAKNKNMGMKLLKAIKALPSKYTSGTYDAHELVLGKIPISSTGEHWVNDLRLELRRAKRDRAAVPWSLKKLCGEISDELQSAAPSPSAFPAKTETGDRDKDKNGKVKQPGNTKKHDGARARKLAGQTLTGTVTSWIKGQGRGQYSFITMEGDASGGNVFVHSRDVEGPLPKEGDTVQFQLKFDSFREGEQPKERAVQVKSVVDKPVANAAAVQTEDDGASDDDSDDGWGCPPTHYRAIVR